MTNSLADKISDSELEVMKLLWQAGDALTVGVLEQEKRKVFYYSPAISQQEYKAWATEELISRLYQGSAKSLIAALVDSKGLSRDDLDELRQMFRVED